MHYSTGREYRAPRYRNTTQHHAPRVIVTPSIDTARTHLASLRVNAAIAERYGLNSGVYTAKIDAILSTFPELTEVTL